MDLIKLLNSYFGYEVKNAAQFKREFRADILPHAQTEHLLSFILHVERRMKDEEEESPTSNNCDKGVM